MKTVVFSITFLFLLVIGLPLAYTQTNGIFNVKDFMATVQKDRIATKYIQNCIDSCYNANGGTVYFPPGEYTSGTLNLKDNRIAEMGTYYTLTNLNQLFLSGNKISVIKGLDTLQNLETLDLGNNEISQIRGLESLMNLKNLWFQGNNIAPELLERLGGLDSGGSAIEPMKFVEYCLTNL